MCARWVEFGRTAKIFFNADAGQVGAVNQKRTNSESIVCASSFPVGNEIKSAGMQTKDSGERTGSWKRIIAEAQMLEGANNR